MDKQKRDNTGKVKWDFLLRLVLDFSSLDQNKGGPSIFLFIVDPLSFRAPLFKATIEILCGNFITESLVESNTFQGGMTSSKYEEYNFEIYVENNLN